MQYILENVGMEDQMLRQLSILENLNKKYNGDNPGK
jgi:hypothetical protein